jgi:hypothetical protein
MREEHIEFSGPNREAWRKNGVGVFERLRNPLPGEVLTIWQRTLSGQTLTPH